MKNRFFLLYPLLLLGVLHAEAQQPPINEPDYNKPRLFNHLPDRMEVNLDNLLRNLEKTPGEAVNILLSADVQSAFQGNLLSNSSKYENSLQTIVVKSNNYNGATLTFSRIKMPDGQISYAGRILSLQHGDLYELMYLDDRYVFVKKEFYDLVNE